MNDYFFSETSLRTKSALDIAILARKKEKEMALLGAQIGAYEARGRKTGGSLLKSALTSLLAIIVK